MAYFAELQSQRTTILEIAKQHGARNVRVFGSVLSKTDTPTSDIDLLVELEKGRGLFDRIALKQELEDLLGRPVDVVTPSSLHWYIRERIVQEAQPL